MKEPRWTVTVTRVRKGWFFYTKDPLGVTVTSGSQEGGLGKAMARALAPVPIGGEYEQRTYGLLAKDWKTQIKRKERNAADHSG